MPYIGQDLQVAYPTYLNIDDISGSFNGSTTSFALLVSGSAPVPLPLNSQQCLISVGGVIQRPDDSGTEGFRLSGGNIIFSSAPNTGEDFFGVILAGADYINAGANFPDGQIGAPSITFDQDNDTGFYRSGSGNITFSSNGVATSIFESNSFTAPSFIPTSSTVPSNGIYLPATNEIAFSTNTTRRATIDSSGRLLVGTSTSVDVGYPLQVMTTTGQIQAYRFSTGAGADGGGIVLGRSKSGSVGTASAVASGDGMGICIFRASVDGSTWLNGATIKGEVDTGTVSASSLPSRLVFSTTADGAASPTERMRIGQNGYFKASTNGTYNGTDVHNFYQSNTNAFGLIVGGYGSYTSTVLVLQGTNSTGTAFNLLEGYRAGNTTTGAGATLSIRVRGDGNVTNSNNSYGAISDIKLKENIVDAGSQWDDLKALQVRKYNFKEGQTHTQIGLVAQEVELVSPGLVSESPDRDTEGNDLGTTTKSVNYSVLYMKAVKALQEAMERIETLEASNTDLLARVSALESA